MNSEKLVMKLGSSEKAFNKAFDELKKENIIERIWKKDHTVWSSDPTEITNRLGWLESPGTSLNAFEEIDQFVKDVKKEGFTKVLLMGMGGSSLAPEVFSKVFRNAEGFPELLVLDSTDPEAVAEYERKLSSEKTLFIVSTKSGGTVETFSFMKFFYNQTFGHYGKTETGKRFVAITDPGSGLEKTAKDLNFRKIFLNDPNIGGRYSALSFFGIVPAALIGIDIKKLLQRAADTSSVSKMSDSPAAKLGAAIGELANQRKDKLTFILSNEIASFGAWVEQLIAESTGKNGKGILPVDGETVQSPEFYSDDRVFIYMHLKDDAKDSDAVKKLTEAGYPVVEIILNDIYDLGEQYFIWELATAVAGWRLGIQPFDQPDVESAKVLAREMMKEYSEKGSLPEQKAIISEDEIKIFGDIKINSVDEALNVFLQNVREKSYVALQAYIKPDNENDKLLNELRMKIMKKYKMAVTAGYGPRFLHSTGQLHKGDAGNGLFIQFTSSAKNDIRIQDKPGELSSSITFGILKSAQAMGDKQALLNKGRKVLSIDFGNNVSVGLKRIIMSI